MAGPSPHRTGAHLRPCLGLLPPGAATLQAHDGLYTPPAPATAARLGKAAPVSAAAYYAGLAATSEPHQTPERRHQLEALNSFLRAGRQALGGQPGAGAGKVKVVLGNEASGTAPVPRIVPHFGAMRRSRRWHWPRGPWSKALPLVELMCLAFASGNCGSESAIAACMGDVDLDSIASSIAYAWFLAARAKMQGSDTLCLPVVNIARADLRLRTETDWLLQDLGLDVPALVFLDEVDLGLLEQAGRLQLVMVDHNRLAAHQEGLQDSIVEIVDHHAPEELYPWITSRNIHQVGSCSTLIAEKISEEAAELLASRGLCKLLLAAILIDTANLDPSSARSTVRDETMVALLLNGAGHLGQHSFFEILIEKKFSAGSLSTRDLLRRDYKQWAMGAGAQNRKGEQLNVGVSAVGIPLSEFLGRDSNVSRELQSYFDDQNLQVLIVMTFYYTPNKNFKRELAIKSSVPGLLDNLCIYLTSDDCDLKLRPISVQGLPEKARAFTQGNVSASRKMLQPLLATFFER
eukprot:SM000281S10750  [mRNA]  locus=s281:76098:79327:- [translate_table: standard]